MCRARRRRSGAPRTRAHRAADPTVLLGHEARLASRRCSRSARQGRARRARRGHDRVLARLESDRGYRRWRAYLRRHERLPHPAPRHRATRLVRRAPHAVRRAGRRSTRRWCRRPQPGGTALTRAERPARSGAPAPRDDRGSAGGPRRSGVPRTRRGQVHVRHRSVPAREHRAHTPRAGLEPPREPGVSECRRRPDYCVEGAMAVAGRAIGWLADGLRAIPDSAASATRLPRRSKIPEVSGSSRHSRGSTPPGGTPRHAAPSSG